MPPSFPQRVRDNILPLSRSNRLPDAFEEWRFTEHTLDHEEPIEVCGLCDKTELRYHFEIENRFTGEELMVGSHCILRFNVPVYDGDQLLDASNSRKKLNQLMRKMHEEACISALEKMLEREDNSILRGALSYFKEHRYLTPKYAFVVLWRLAENGVHFNPRFFNIRLNTDHFKSDFECMSQHKINTIWPALSDSQRKLAVRLGHSKPPKS